MNNQASEGSRFPVQTERCRAAVHALKRMQQRGISAEDTEIVIAYGSRHNEGHKRSAYHMDRAAMARAEKAGFRVERLRDVAVILENDQIVITVLHAPNKPKYWRGGR